MSQRPITRLPVPPAATGFPWRCENVGHEPMIRLTHVSKGQADKDGLVTWPTRCVRCGTWYTITGRFA